ncbi:unnamed protein product [Schistocephalus solidus]|uniref:Ragulator complex protein LAMTOR2 n=1 Tax=Schistocephalus solidus TaxID=70667 RepID=A0A0X3PXK3_SCHSO|nr:unnamed protein product [Schistocephalus solidus]
MLRPRALASALAKVNTGGVQSIMLFSTEGVLLTHTGIIDENEKTKAAIVANIWNIYQKQLELSECETVQEIIIELTHGRLVFTKVASVLICIHGSKDIGLGLLRAKINSLVENLQGPLSFLTS